MERRCVVLSSGGVDSTTTMAMAKQAGYSLYSLSFDYGQRNRYELECARSVAAHFKVQEHLIFSLNLGRIGGSALTSNKIDVPLDRSDEEIKASIPITYVPARNLIFLSIAVAWAEVQQIIDIFIGVNAVDFSGYPDCRPAFIRSFEETANLGTRLGVEGQDRLIIHTPLINLSKREIIQKGLELGVDYGLTSSCYQPDSSGKPCGRCDSCNLRQRGFLELGQKDPLKR